jgi:hypothetical protein
VLYPMVASDWLESGSFIRFRGKIVSSLKPSMEGLRKTN